MYQAPELFKPDANRFAFLPYSSLILTSNLWILIDLTKWHDCWMSAGLDTAGWMHLAWLKTATNFPPRVTASNGTLCRDLLHWKHLAGKEGSWIIFTTVSLDTDSIKTKFFISLQKLVLEKVFPQGYWGRMKIIFLHKSVKTLESAF